MVLGFGPIGSAPLGSLDDDFEVELDVELHEADQPIIEVVSFIDRKLIEHLHQSPEELKTIDRRNFEKLIAELFSGFGYEVELTKQTRDGGKDIIAIKRKEVDVRFLIECKRPDPGNLVSVGTVRALYGVKVSEGASKAILATTSYLTPDAKLLVERHRWELESRDYDAIKEWLAEYLKLLGSNPSIRRGR